MVPLQAQSKLAAPKRHQQSIWSPDDDAVIGAALATTGELLCKAVDLRPGQHVLKIVARRQGWATSAEHAPRLLNRGHARISGQGVSATFQTASVEELPFFAGNSFDVALSVFDAMFTPNHEQAAQEMLRVCRPGGTIGLLNWTPDSFIGRLVATIEHYVPSPHGVKSPALWGTELHLRELFGEGVSTLQIKRRSYMFQYGSPEHFLSYCSSLLKSFATLDAEARTLLAIDLLGLLEHFNQGDFDAPAAPSAYLEVVATRR